MSATQKHAWFNIAVIGGTLLLVACLYPFLGWSANGALGLAGLLGLGPVFYRKSASEVVMDERDILIQRRATLLGYTAFWLVFVLVAALLSPLVYGQEGNIPVIVVQLSVFYAMVLFVGVTSLATLIQNARG